MLNSFRSLFSNSRNRKTRRVSGLPRPELLRFEDRITPAAFVYNGVSGALTIDLNNTDEVLTLTSSGGGNYVFTSTSNFTGTNTTGLTGNGTKTLTITSALTLTDVVITDSVGVAGTDVGFGANTGAYVDNFSITLDVAGASVVTVANPTAFSGAAGLNVAAARNIVINANLSTVTGNIVLDADNGVQQTGGFVGVDISNNFGSEVTTSGGNITIEGRGGDTGSNRYGVYLFFGAKVQAGGTGTVSVTGTGGASSGASGGVLVDGSGLGSIITSSGGSVTVIGTGGGTGATSGNNYGLQVFNSGVISAGGTGTVSVTGTGGAGGGNFNVGVQGLDANSKITSSGGSVTVIGTGGGTGTTSGNNVGLLVVGGFKISAGGTGTVSVTGTGGAGGGNFNVGVFVSDAGSKITSSGGSVTVIGTAGGTGASDLNYGVDLTDSGEISAGGTGTVSVTGIGGVGASSTGIDLNSANNPSPTITTNSSGAAITLTADSMAFDPTSVVSSTGTVTLQNKTAGVAINLGTETTGQLSLTDAELDRVTAGTLVIGRSGVNPGVITVSNALTLPSTVSALQLIGPTGITLNNNVTTTGSQTYTGAVTLGASSTLNAGSGNILLPGTVSNFGAGAFSLTPITSGAGLTTISGPNTNTTTNVTTGVVQINNTTASTTNFAVSGGTLKGTGSIGNLTGTGTGIIAPGNSPGLVTTTNLSLSSTNTLQIEINYVSPPVAGIDYDQIVVSSG